MNLSAVIRGSPVRLRNQTWEARMVTSVTSKIFTVPQRLVAVVATILGAGFVLLAVSISATAGVMGAKPLSALFVEPTNPGANLVVWAIIVIAVAVQVAIAAGAVFWLLQPHKKA